ncbi:biotin-dependent carboxyltransferase family protein [Modestobacter sp. VKM Ac-2979]|uniref:5-oxoprolinase subunit C family protein n=1 Tax=unclassified Modestobacter TaxID=2643866 RepID=UPI0022AB66BE|nr:MULTISPECIES: biotin-dependent carboxyltransferase family protein [unclassified Modestobacter]MCZ2814066.1 biotin-dependent carboxyltransferase family protein [Modestobacter sp. VKM Ac-2979]MCZ2844518.1 biotin-dependent carboxyltransferase family protein [Modestobacter sp. VKM Ac-2980]
MSLTVLATGPLTTVQDLGRPGQAALGIGRSGACDRASAALANRLVGNRADAAVLEVTFGGLTVRAEADLLVVSTGARCPGAPHAAPTVLRRGQELRLGPPASGLRTYLAVRGGIAVPPVLGSRATDLLAGLGPAVVATGDVLPVGEPVDPAPGVDLAPVPEPTAGELTATVLPGPRADWFGDAGWAALTGQAWTVTSESNRVGLRLDGAPLERLRAGELPSEGMVRGALQVPPSGLPVLFLADHPVTGGYPVIGYVTDADVDACAQLRPGQALRLRPGRP